MSADDLSSGRTYVGTRARDCPGKVAVAVQSWPMGGHLAVAEGFAQRCPPVSKQERSIAQLVAHRRSASGRNYVGTRVRDHPGKVAVAVPVAVALSW